MMPTLAPIPADQPLPHRKTLREWLIPLSTRTTAWALLLLAFDYTLLLAAFAGTVLLHAWWAKALCGLAAGFVTGRLFIIGHDACHQSLTPHRGLNRWLGRIAFLPSLTPYSLWDVGHNVVHHGYTNLKGVDFVWAPLTREEYAALPPLQRGLNRLYRSGWAPGLYYFVEIWWKKMYFPNRTQMPTRRPIFVKDGLLVSAFALLWAGGLVAGALAAGQSLALVLATGFALPFLFWNSMIGFVVYVHHTHVKVSWHEDKAAWAKAQPFVSTTVHLTFPFRIGALLHHIMEHTAHHVDMSIPLYRLKQAQARLEELLPARIIVQPFSWRWYFETARQCKLYDFRRRCWTDYRGRPTSARRPQIA
ncbi:fatty acid desaturase [Ramlibacter sp. 2FC]|uniref:fatty acid desaturase n=1 Tax=Ramlibacter sp. 2FC TaxID=2502188 RepID=UPI00148543E9|nr:fatty acid desaturase [Ramlibacter sp. 2FC]